MATTGLGREDKEKLKSFMDDLHWTIVEEIGPQGQISSIQTLTAICA